MTTPDPAHNSKEAIVDEVILAAGDPIAHAVQIKAQEELLAAACEATRLLQDRQAHTPEEMLDGREHRVLRQLRDAVRRAS